jgi:hypothetical protein
VLLTVVHALHQIAREHLFASCIEKPGYAAHNFLPFNSRLVGRAIPIHFGAHSGQFFWL